MTLGGFGDIQDSVTSTVSSFNTVGSEQRTRKETVTSTRLSPFFLVVSPPAGLNP